MLFAIPSLGGGGAEKVLITLLNNLDENKYDITLFSLFNEGVNKKYLNGRIKYKYFFKRLFRGNIYLLKLFNPSFLYKKMIKDEYDIVVSYLEGPMTRIISGCTSPNTKLFNWVHTDINLSNDLLRSYRNLDELVESYGKYTATVFVSNTAKVSFLNCLGKISQSSIVKYNTVDTDYIKLKSISNVDKVNFASDRFNLISVGRFIELKGYARLIRIISRLIKEDNINVHLYLLGKGDQEQQYRSLIEDLELTEHITLLGFKENPYKYVRSADLFVCSSYREGYSTAVTESLIVGTPVVTTLCSGMEELLGHNNEYGIITENDDNALYLGIKRILSESGLLKYYKKQAMIKGQSFSTENTVEEIEKLLDI